MKRMAWCVALVSLAAVCAASQAAGVEADPKKEYWLTPTDGPYMIFVASYRGDEARELANKLVFELRNRYRLPAYLYSKSEEEHANQEKWLDELHAKYGEGQRFKKVRIVDDFAVLVGHWKDMESARSDLNKIKKAPAPESVPLSGITFMKTKWDHKTKALLDAKADAHIDKPFSQAFVTHNPLAPKELAKQEIKGKYDPVWVELNAKEKYSLFKNQKPWTLIVQVYQGTSVTESAPKPSVFDRDKPGSRTASMDTQIKVTNRATGRNLDTLSADAAKLAESLRDKGRGYDAYVFHTRDASLVTVGGFRGPNDPEMLKMQQQLSKVKIGQTKLLDTPVPFEVPKP